VLSCVALQICSAHLQLCCGLGYARLSGFDVCKFSYTTKEFVMQCSSVYTLLKSLLLFIVVILIF
jgi:hypothetical protein